MDVNIALPAVTNAAGAWGCDSPDTATVTLLNDDGSRPPVYPCFEFRTLVDNLEDAGISWRYSAPGQGQSGYICSVLDAIGHIRINPTLWDWTPD
jgi:phospholipase C